MNEYRATKEQYEEAVEKLKELDELFLAGEPNKEFATVRLMFEFDEFYMAERGITGDLVYSALWVDGDEAMEKFTDDIYDKALKSFEDRIAGLIDIEDVDDAVNVLNRMTYYRERRFPGYTIPLTNTVIEDIVLCLEEIESALSFVSRFISFHLNPLRF